MQPFFNFVIAALQNRHPMSRDRVPVGHFFPITGSIFLDKHFEEVLMSFQGNFALHFGHAARAATSRSQMEPDAIIFGKVPTVPWVRHVHFTTIGSRLFRSVSLLKKAYPLDSIQFSSMARLCSCLPKSKKVYFLMRCNQTELSKMLEDYVSSPRSITSELRKRRADWFPGKLILLAHMLFY